MVSLRSKLTSANLCCTLTWLKRIEKKSRLIVSCDVSSKVTLGGRQPCIAWIFNPLNVCSSRDGDHMNELWTIIAGDRKINFIVTFYLYLPKENMERKPHRGARETSLDLLFMSNFRF